MRLSTGKKKLHESEKNKKKGVGLVIPTPPNTARNIKKEHHTIMITHKFIDYLQFNTFPEMIPVLDNAIPVTPFNGYKWGVRLEDQTRVYGGHNKSDKCLVIQSGEAMREIRENYSELQHLEQILSEGAKITRIDLAMDIYIDDCFLTPLDFVKFYGKGKIISCHAEYAPKFIGGLEIDQHNRMSKNIETLSFGDLKKRGKKGMARVYDKGIELDLEKYMITRVEVEDKRDKAHVSAKRVLDHGVASVLKTRFDVEDDLYQSLIGAHSIDITRGTGKAKNKELEENSRWQWLIETVAPSLGKQLASDDLQGIEENRLLFESAMLNSYIEHMQSNKLDKSII